MFSGIFNFGKNTPPANSIPLERKNFNNDKEKLGKNVQDIALNWFENASYLPNPGEKIVSRPGISVQQLYNTKTKTVSEFYIFTDPTIEAGDIEPLLLHAQKADLKEISKFSDSEFAAYKFFFNKLVHYFNDEASSTMYKVVIMQSEDITNLYDSVVLKNAAVAMVKELKDSNDDRYKDMLNTDKRDWWTA
jgi:hypothetical protein